MSTVIVETYRACEGYRTKFRNKYSVPAGAVAEVPAADGENWVSHKHAEILGEDGPERLKKYNAEIAKKAASEADAYKKRQAANEKKATKAAVAAEAAAQKTAEAEAKAAAAADREAALGAAQDAQTADKE